jgi:serine/threonine protein phosphatase PrpC
MATHSATKSLLLCVMDGHGENGDGVAIYMKRNFPDKLFNHPSFATDIEKAITDALDACENELLKKTKIDCEFSGTTFVCAVVRDGLVTCANVGDSRCIVGVKGPDGKLAGVAVSIDHKPELPLEKARILKAGGRVFAVQYDDGIPGPNRVWLGNIDVPGLAMSRSIGDTVAHTAGVTSIPEFFTQKLVEGQHAVMVLASDGLWEFMDDQAVMDKINEGTPGKDVAGIVDILVEEANSLWLKAEEVIDDTTVCVACLYGHTISAPSRK